MIIKRPSWDVIKAIVLFALIAVWFWHTTARDIRARRQEKLKTEIKSGVDEYYGTNYQLSTSEQKMLDSISGAQSK